MPLTRDFKDTIKARADKDPEFRRGLLVEAIECFLGGELDTGKLVLRNYVNATVGFQDLARLTGKKDTSLMRMLGPEGNPTARNLLDVLSILAQQEQLDFSIEMKPHKEGSKGRTSRKRAAVRRRSKAAAAA